jgi:methionyl aminopeptidase
MIDAENAMSIASKADWSGMQRVAVVVRLTLEALATAVRPGVTTAELDAVAREVVAAHGARSAPAILYGFPATVLISVNDEVVHGVPGQRRLARGDVVSLDVTLEKDGYIADAARTVLVEGGSEAATRLVACAEAAFEAALEVARAGTPVNEIGRTVEREVKRWGFTVVRGLTGHGVGRAIHEPPTVANEYDPRQRAVLTDGLVLTIEPMISAGTSRTVQDRDGWTIRTRDGSLASHHEHTLVITRDRPVVLTAAA